MKCSWSYGGLRAALPLDLWFIVLFCIEGGGGGGGGGGGAPHLDLPLGGRVRHHRDLQLSHVLGGEDYFFSLFFLTKIFLLLFTFTSAVRP